MPKEEWGVKRLCPTTGKRFYDLNKTPPVSPYTGEVVNIDTSGKARSLSADKAESKPEDLVDDAEVVLDDADDDTTDVDLGDDVLDDEDEGNVSLEEIADVPAEDDDN
ncbi:TIGR02300 family protein [Halocynthiibacter namhaensis]|uniref:TIGR02300 family protein n=1 Tax=Halocynthiibacter namhaensis TaxID=1290553 RepID=UPI00057922A6|nr:TIGR02300 family protein [Halocynthiibacter namhaensis]